MKPLNLTADTIVEPIGVRRNKGRTYLEYRYVKPEDKAKSNELGDLPMTSKDPDVRSVRDVINVMHKWPETLQQIGINAATASTVTQAKMAAWSAMLADWKAVGPEWNVSRQREQLDGVCRRRFRLGSRDAPLAHRLLCRTTTGGLDTVNSLQWRSQVSFGLGVA